MPQPTLAKRAITELIGTFVLVFLGTGAVVTVVTRLGFLGPTGGEGTGLVPGGLLLIGLAFGFAVLVMIYAFGHISGTHINPVVSICLWATGRFPAKDMVAVRRHAAHRRHFGLPRGGGHLGSGGDRRRSGHHPARHRHQLRGQPSWSSS